MTDEAKALVERLREKNEWTNQRPYFHAHNKCLEAADLIETQAREIERLRAALENIVNDCDQCGGYGTYPEEETVTGKVLWWDCSSPQCQHARAALAGDSHDQ